MGAGEGRRARAIGAKRGMDAKDGSETEVLLDCLFSFLKSHFFHCDFHFSSHFLHFLFLAFSGQIAGYLGKIVSVIP